MVFAFKSFAVFVLALTYFGGAMCARAADFRILVVMSYEKPSENIWCGEIKEGIESVIGGSGRIDYFYMNTKVNFNAGQQMAKNAHDLFRMHRYDGVIVADDNAQKMFVVPYMKDAVAIPVIFCGVNSDPSVYGYPATNVTGILERGHFRESIALIKQLAPQVRSIGFVAKDSPSGKALKKQVEMESDTYLAEVATFELVTTLNDIASERALYDCDALFVDSLIGIQNDQGIALDNKQVITFLKKTFNKPIVGANNVHVSSGALCAVVKTGQEQGEGAAEKLLQAMQGTPISSIPVTRNHRGKRVINVTEMKRLELRPTPRVLIGAQLVRTE